MTKNELKKLALTAIYYAQSGHPGGTLSALDIMHPLFFEGIMHPQPYDFNDPNRDIFILSKGHSAPALYTVLYALGEISKEDLFSLRKLGSTTQGHPARRWLPQVVTSTGSLGQGFAFAVGLAMAIKPRRVFCLIGDGALQEGIVAEAARIASYYHLTNLVVLCDRNYKTSDVHSIDFNLCPTGEFEMWGWDITEVAPWNLNQIGASDDFPLFIEIETQKGSGVLFMENDPAGYHGSLALSDQEFRQAIEALDGWVNVESSNLKRVKWEESGEAPGFGLLIVEFEQGRVYEYEAVPESIFSDLTNAELPISKGYYFNERVRKAGYRYQEVTDEKS